MLNEVSYCQRILDWDNAPFRPFCSDRCRLIDLGASLSEQRTIPGDSAVAPDELIRPNRFTRR